MFSLCNYVYVSISLLLFKILKVDRTDTTAKSGLRFLVTYIYFYENRIRPLIKN